MTSAITTTEQRAPARQDPRMQRFIQLRDFLTPRKNQVAAIAGKALDTERVLKIVLDAAASNKKLLECSPESLLRAMLYCAKVQLEPVGAWGVWLVPYGNQVTPVIDYRALVNIVKRSGDVRTIVAHVVYENDSFDVVFGDDEAIAHKPVIDSDKRGKFVAVYAIATLKDGARQRVVLSKADVDRYRAKSRASSSGPWVTDYEAMAMKTAIRRLCNLLPVAMETSQLLDEEEREQGFEPTITADADETPAEGEQPEAIPAQVPSSKADALKADLRARQAPVAPASGPVIDTTATPSAPSSEQAPVEGGAKPQEPAGDAMTSSEMESLKAQLGALQGELAAIVGKDAAMAAWNGGRGVQSLRGVRRREHADQRLQAAQRLVELAKLDVEIKRAWKELGGSAGPEVLDLLRSMHPAITAKAFERTTEDGHKALDAVLKALDEMREGQRPADEAEDLPWGGREPGSDG